MGFSTRLRLVALVLLAAATTGCRSRRAAAADIPQGTYYTKYSLYFEKDLTRTTNYRRGILLPINTEVALLSSRGDRIVVEIHPDGRKLTIENVPRHTGGSLEDAFAQVLSSEPTDISGYSEEEQQAIEGGKAIVGMSKDAVLAAMGPPPQTGTLSLESNTWKYWDTRFTTFNVVFGEDGRVTNARQR
ncbi:MAG: hypothetical protein KDE27_16980 [Planctomycetes bacterium]|nr:hypothetical protein [Planctomycetota bacterium]